MSIRESVGQHILARLQQVGQAGSLGVELAQGAGCSLGTITNALAVLNERGLILSHPHPSRYANNRRRWYLADQRPVEPPVVPKVVAGFKKAAPVGAAAAVLPVIPAGVQVQVLPGYTHNQRAQVAPGAAVHGAGFAALGVGRYLESEARR